ncbi:hypothetical protein Tco_0864026 [Tanacetum coccineum]
MSWEDFKTLTREEFCLSNEMQKLETELCNHAMVKAGHAAYTDRSHELASQKGLSKGRADRLDTLMMKPFSKMDPSQKDPEIGWKNGGEPSKDSNVRDDNKSTRTGNVFATTANPVRVGFLTQATRVRHPKCTPGPITIHLRH